MPDTRPPSPLIVRHLGLSPYEPVWRTMQQFSRERGAATPDELWLVEHPPVFTLGLNGRPHHILDAGEIPVVAVDRGGQVTYHGPGQIVVYLLLDLRRLGLGVRQVVSVMENAVIRLLADYGLAANARADAPGVYVGGAKIAALGLRVRTGRCYHGLALNVDMDLTPYHRIDPCGYPGMPITQLRNLGVTEPPDTIAGRLLGNLSLELGYTGVTSL